MIRFMENLINKIREIGQAEFARSVGATKQQVWNWLNRGSIPSEYVVKAESATGIPCWEIDPVSFPPERFKKSAK